MKFISIIVLLVLLQTCGSDTTKELGAGYWLRIEGGSANEIFNHNPSLKEIPPSVMKYDYDDNFIIVEQKPNKFDDVMHEEKIEYSYGREQLYYWIIIKSKYDRIGPMNELEFKQARVKYHVPLNLELKSVN